MKFRFHQTTVSKDFVNFLFKLFNKQKTFSSSINVVENCYLTFNLIKEIPLKFRAELTGGLFNTKDVHHLHMLKFPTKGTLDYHDHSKFERYSYVLYMDNVGGTLFQDNNDEIFFKSRKGKLIIFDSEIFHKAVTGKETRYTAGGGILKKTKEV
mgnify:FL=1